MISLRTTSRARQRSETIIRQPPAPASTVEPVTHVLAHKYASAKRYLRTAFLDTVTRGVLRDALDVADAHIRRACDLVVRVDELESELQALRDERDGLNEEAQDLRSERDGLLGELHTIQVAAPAESPGRKSTGPADTVALSARMKARPVEMRTMPVRTAAQRRRELGLG